MVVVDSDVEVHGIRRLRVCDNSVGLNLDLRKTKGLAMVIAERTVDRIQHGCPQAEGLPA